MGLDDAFYYDEYGYYGNEDDMYYDYYGQYADDFAGYEDYYSVRGGFGDMVAWGWDLGWGQPGTLNRALCLP
jgi:hypothetical protein